MPSALHRHIQMIFQDPFSAMNPRMMIKDIIQEGLVAQGIQVTTEEQQMQLEQLLQQVGLPSNAQYRYPHEFSGGQRQRICIARALAMKPKLIICDEPTSALDVSVQAQVLNLLRRLQAELNLTYLFISHDISVVSYMADWVAVMYLGRIVEQGPVNAILQLPKHPYTQALMAAVPSIEAKKPMVAIKGEQASPISPPSGCHYHPRCPHAMTQCRNTYPDKSRIENDHIVRCYLYSDDKER